MTECDLLNMTLQLLEMWTYSFIAVASILGVGEGRDPQILKWGSWRWVGGSWRVWFQVFYAVKGRDGNPGPPVFKPD
jgi:hypothetical protein